MSTRESLTATCPACAKSFEVDASYLGRHGRCDACQTKFVITASAPHPARHQANATASFSTRFFAVAAVVLVCAGAGLWWVKRGGSKADTEAAVLVKRASDSPVIASATVPPPVVAETVSHNVQKNELKPLEKSFPVIREFSPIDIREYRETYEDVHMGWMPQSADQAEEAKR